MRVVFAIILGLAGASCRRTEVSKADILRVEAVGNRLIQQIEKYEAQNGAYPRSLEEARIQNPRTTIGQFQYRINRNEARECFELEVGNYTTVGFTLFFNSCSEDRTWSLEE